MNDRPKLTIKKPLSIEKQSQLSQALQYLLSDVIEKPSATDQEHLMKEAQKKKREGIKTALGWLYEQFPACFTIKEIKPLKLHIEKDIYPYLEQEGAPSKIKVRLALKYYTHNINYVKSLISSTHRYDLSGQKVEEVTQEQKTFAQDKLKKFLEIMKTKKLYKNKALLQEKADNP